MELIELEACLTLFMNYKLWIVWLTYSRQYIGLSLLLKVLFDWYENVKFWPFSLNPTEVHNAAYLKTCNKIKNNLLTCSPVIKWL